MNELIARVARVIDPLAFGDWTVPPRGLESAPRHIVDAERQRRQRKAEKVARASVLTMREPTDAMIRYGQQNNGGEHTIVAWKAMIDAALADGPALPVKDRPTSHSDTGE